MYLADFHKVIKNAPNYAQWSEYIKTQALKTVRKGPTKAHTHTCNLTIKRYSSKINNCNSPMTHTA